MIFALANGLLWAFLRRWYGGLFPEGKHKILGNRALQSSVMILAMLPCFLADIHSLRNWSFAIGMALWLQFQFWSRGHGATNLDMGRDKNPDISRYDRWFKKPLNWLYNKIGKYDKIYGYSYDMWYTGLRYTLPLIVPAIFINLDYLVIGIFNPFVYEQCIRLHERYPGYFKYKWCDKGHKLAEIVYGFIFGFGISVL